MKKIFALLLTVLPFAVKAQYTSIQCGPNISPAVNYVYLGSLTMTPENGANSQKMQVDIIGGDWAYTYKGTTTFYIANRGGLSVNQVTTGGAAYGGNLLLAYANGSNTDFYLAVNSSTGYHSLAVRSFIFGHAYGAQQAAITTSVSTPPGINITSTFTVNLLQTTDINGNIGIGTMDPKGYKLAVNGNVISNSMTVKMYPWADYVFKPDYYLMPLQEVKEYINKNRHLPEIPSENEVLEKGLNLGEMNKLLLRKIEELTLYLIEKDGQISDQNQRLSEQKKVIDQLKIDFEQIKAEFQTKF